MIHVQITEDIFSVYILFTTKQFNSTTASLWNIEPNAIRHWNVASIHNNKAHSIATSYKG